MFFTCHISTYFFAALEIQCPQPQPPPPPPPPPPHSSQQQLRYGVRGLQLIPKTCQPVTLTPWGDHPQRVTMTREPQLVQTIRYSLDDARRIR